MSSYKLRPPRTENWSTPGNYNKIVNESEKGICETPPAVDMVERLTVIFFIILCMLLGFYLILSPWDALFGPWGENYLLVFLSDKAGAPVIQKAVASTWFRGAVTSLGVLNLLIAFWEIAHFNQSVKMLQGNETRDES